MALQAPLPRPFVVVIFIQCRASCRLSNRPRFRPRGGNPFHTRFVNEFDHVHGILDERLGKIEEESEALDDEEQNHRHPRLLE
jgi:hypothetical protein